MLKCRATRSLQPFAMAYAAGPCPRRRQRLTNGLASSFQTYSPAYVELEAAEQRTTGSKHLLQMTHYCRMAARVRASHREACSCVGQFLSLPSTSVDDSSFSRPKLSAGSRSPDAEFAASVAASEMGGKMLPKPT